jgi:hypothetical protein
MTPPNRLLAVVAVIASTAVAFPAAASAKPKPGEATFEWTYPVASRICAKVAAGTENKHLKANLAEVQAACTTLQSSFTQAATTVLSARNTLEPQIAADRSSTAAACATAKPVLACNHTRHANEIAIHSLAVQLRLAKHTYFVSVDAARTAFWAVIHTIPGEHRAAADQPQPIPPA